ncbi:ORF6N domain-containing protein, partial [Salmonella enterica subsp. enterica]|nr:ORF6N domain-containing protein [Salmonella enterica subsp. enterica serovar Kisangani]
MLKTPRKRNPHPTAMWFFYVQNSWFMTGRV